MSLEVALIYTTVSHRRPTCYRKHRRREGLEHEVVGWSLCVSTWVSRRGSSRKQRRAEQHVASGYRRLHDLEPNTRSTAMRLTGAGTDGVCCVMLGAWCLVLNA